MLFRARTVLSAVLLSVAAVSGIAPAARAQTLPVLNIATTPTDIGSQVFYAQERGFFKAAGIDAQIQVISNGAAITSAVMGGAVDVAQSNVVSLATAHEKGFDVAIVAPAGQYATNQPTSALVVAKNSPIKTAKDLNGKTIGVSTLHDLQQASVLKWVDANGGDSSTLKFAETPVPVMAPALAAGRIDAACLLEPSLTAAKDDIRIFGKCYDAIAKSLMITSHFANTAWLDAHPDAAHAFIGALRESARWANRNLAASSAILADKSKIPLETIAAMHRVQFGEALDPALIQPVIDASAQYKFLPKDFNVSEMFWAQAR